MDFSHIRDFDTPETATILGNAVSDISEMALREIATTVRSLQRAEKEQNRTFAKRFGLQYDEAERTNNQPENERSENDDSTDLHPEGRLPDAQSGSAGGPADRQVRDDAAQVPAGPSPGDLRRDAPEGDAERASGADRPAGERDDGDPDHPDGSDAGRDGGAEGVGSDVLGETDERDPSPGGGDRDAGSDLRIEPFPTEEEQKNMITEAEEEKASAFVISQEDIDAVLLRGSGFSEGKLRIYAQFLKNETSAENAKFLKKEYGTGGSYPAVPGKPISEDHNCKGILIRYGRLTNPNAEVRLTWLKVAKRIGELIQADRYLNDAKKEQYHEWRQQTKTPQPEQLPGPSKEYRFSLGDTVFIGTQEYEILFLGEDVVRLYDPAFPLINKELTRSEFNRAVAENPLNDKHLVAVSEQLPAEKENGASEPAQDDRADEMMRHALMAAELAAQTGQDLFVFGEDDLLPISPQQEQKDAASADNPELAPPEPVRRRSLPPSILYPEISSDYRTNFQIENDDIGVGTPLERFHHNVMAIQLLKKLENEHRLAGLTEQRVLADYVGWGGLASCFEEENSHYKELRNLLTEEEYAAARESTLTAFYTPPVVIRSIYQALEQMGFRRGNILEPSCGIGNFMGMLPIAMRDSKLYGVELDSISGRIAQQLYQQASIAVQGFEQTELPDSFFDAAIGNVPFGQFKVSDKRYDKHNFLIHDYFFAKALDKVRPGGIIAFVTSKGTLDKENPAVRKYIAQRADLLGAIRLPYDTVVLHPNDR